MGCFQDTDGVSDENNAEEARITTENDCFCGMCKIRPVTHIFNVPFGPRFIFITSCSPFAAEMLMASAWEARANSALGFNKLIEDIIKTVFSKTFENDYKL